MVQSPLPVTQWELDVRFVEGLYSQLEILLMLLPFVWNQDNSLYLLYHFDTYLQSEVNISILFVSNIFTAPINRL